MNHPSIPYATWLGFVIRIERKGIVHTALAVAKAAITGTSYNSSIDALLSAWSL